MAQLAPYINFVDTCHEAVSFYRDCLGGDLTIPTIGESPAARHMPAEAQDQVLHAMLTREGMVIMASDMADPGAGTVGPITLCINSSDRAEIKDHFAKLSDGANVTQPLKEEFFGLFGILADRYGINEMFQAD